VRISSPEAAAGALDGEPDYQLLEPYAQSLSLALLRGREAVMSRFRPILRAHGVTEQQWRVLRILHDHPDIEVTALSRIAFLRGPSLTRILRDLCERKLVLRRIDAADMRRARVSISPIGMALVREAGRDVAVAVADVQWRFGTERGTTLRSLLLELEQSVGLQELDPVGDDERARSTSGRP
jgi:homoprotocatechuate degradation regulator HpaR